MMSWYAVYTSSRAEKRVKERLDGVGIENYLPLQIKIRTWSDRKKKVLIPLISGYVFVCIDNTQINVVREIPGVVGLLCEKSVPAIIPDNQIIRLRMMVDNFGEEVEFTNEQIQVGDHVTVKLGKLAGLSGEMVEIRGKYKIAVRLDKLGCALITLPFSCIEKV